MTQRSSLMPCWKVTPKSSCSPEETQTAATIGLNFITFYDNSTKKSSTHLNLLNCWKTTFIYQLLISFSNKNRNSLVCSHFSSSVFPAKTVNLISRVVIKRENCKIDHHRSSPDVLLLEQYRSSLNYKLSAWDRLDTEINIWVLAALLFEWLEHLKTPILDKDSITYIVIHCDNLVTILHPTLFAKFTSEMNNFKGIFSTVKAVSFYHWLMLPAA